MGSKVVQALRHLQFRQLPEVGEVELTVCYLHGRQLLELHRAEHLWQKHFVRLVSIERMMQAC